MPAQKQNFTHTWRRYRHNPLRSLNALSAYIEKRTMATLQSKGFCGLSMAFSAPMTVLAQKPARPTELASALNISKQLCNQALRPIIKAGYVEQRPDPRDGRAKQLALTKQGEALVAAASRELIHINQDISDALGADGTLRFSAAIQSLTDHYQLIGMGSQTLSDYPSMLLGMLNRRLHKHMMELLAAQSDYNLNLSYAQVLLLIDKNGTPMQDMADYNGVSLQAISRIASELEERGFITRRVADDDRRSRKIYFTERGLKLIDDSVVAMDKLERQLAKVLVKSGQRKPAFEHLARQLDTLCAQLINTDTSEQSAKINCDEARVLENPQPGMARLLRYFEHRLEGHHGDVVVSDFISQQLGPGGVSTLNQALALLGKACR